MSLKENVDYIKQEISNEEKFFESFFKVEKFWKKYKLIIIITIVGVLGYFISNGVMNYIEEQNDIKANIAYNKLLKNPQDTKSIDILKQTNKTLLDIAMYKNSKDNTTNTDVEYLKQIALFNKAIKNNDIKALDKLIVDQDFVLREYALFNKALILSNNKSYQKAKETLKLIPQSSNVKQISNLLEHYLLTK
jgi:tetratricopeptide (TPR) repeat protein